jgi:alkanesulfonate monooxygenase SsuD/methylene tetrahydromethanopterin reductase-like flavin-dependent oxidoreductase (luciferase family)
MLRWAPAGSVVIGIEGRAAWSGGTARGRGRLPTCMPVEIGVILPTSTPDPARPILGDVRASARLAEQLGLDSVWSTDHLIASAPILDSTAVLATAAAVTERISIGYGVMLLALRPVAWAAKQISTLQHLSGGRLLLGIGTGNPAHGDIGWRAAGASYPDRGRATDHTLRVLPALVAGQPATLDDGLQVTLTPGATMPPVLIAGNGPAARRRAAAHATSWMSIGLTPQDVAAGLAQLAELAAEHARPTPTATVVAPILDADPARAAAQLSAYADAGTERVILPPTGPDWRATFETAAKIRTAQ